MSDLDEQMEVEGLDLEDERMIDELVGLIDHYRDEGYKDDYSRELLIVNYQPSNMGIKRWAMLVDSALEY